MSVIRHIQEIRKVLNLEAMQFYHKFWQMSFIKDNCTAKLWQTVLTIIVTLVLASYPLSAKSAESAYAEAGGGYCCQCCHCRLNLKVRIPADFPDRREPVTEIYGTGCRGGGACRAHRRVLRKRTENCAGCPADQQSFKRVEEGLLLSNTRMHNMAEVIQKISDKSSEINKIVKTIGHIDFITWRKSSKRSATNQARSTRL